MGLNDVLVEVIKWGVYIFVIGLFLWLAWRVWGLFGKRSKGDVLSPLVEEERRRAFEERSLIEARLLGERQAINKFNPQKKPSQERIW